MGKIVHDYEEKIVDEIHATPPEHLPNLFLPVRLFRESVTLKSAEGSFIRGMKEALADNTRPISELWDKFGHW